MYTYTAFEDFRVLSRGSIEVVALAVKKQLKTARTSRILIFSDSTGQQLDFDLSGTDRDVLERLKIYSAPAPAAASRGSGRGAGRPKLGVVAREISLLPGHWEWLANQAGGASSSIRQLIDEKIKEAAADKNKIKSGQEVTYRFLTALAGDFAGFEEAIRFLYRREQKKFRELISTWPKDIVEHAEHLSRDVF